jgi:CopG family nickel-responsive transcriptional regulator
MKALETANNGARDLEYVAFAFLHDQIRNTMDIAYMRAQIGGLRKPSGMCIPSLGNTFMHFSVTIIHKSFMMKPPTHNGRRMTKIVRVGVTFPPDLLRDFDKIIRKMGYENRSKAVQDVVNMFVSEKKWLQEESGTQAGVLMMLFDHEVKGLESALTNVQHLYAHVICSTMHIHLSESDCLEAIAVKGDAAEVRRLSDELTAKRGVKLLKTMFVSI